MLLIFAEQVYKAAQLVPPLTFPLTSKSTSHKVKCIQLDLAKAVVYLMEYFKSQSVPSVGVFLL